MIIFEVVIKNIENESGIRRKFTNGGIEKYFGTSSTFSQILMLIIELLRFKVKVTNKNKLNENLSCNQF